MKAWEIGLGVAGVAVAGVVGVMLWNQAQTAPPTSPVVPPPGTDQTGASPQMVPPTTTSGLSIGRFSRRRPNKAHR